ncbi:FAD-dependent oxidoreductase [Holdemania filiformis]|uniref:FAD-dependent oxidoreductase n=1 Tax=Holdemania filiformis TaxID=61171 RepID=UPI00267533ED|nr:FAD-dependent oxidoreductase [Holdemania filiformis]
MKKYLALILGLCLTVGLGGCANTPAEKTPETQPESGNEQFDIVIVGAGGAGLAAAVEAHEQGADNILVLEKMSFAGGSTTMAFGGFNCTNSRFMDEQGKEETPVMLVDKIVKNGAGFADVDMAGIIAMETPKVIEWLDGFGSEWGKIRYADLHCPTDGTIPGVELVKVLKEQAEKNGIEIRYNSPAVDLIADESGRVSGVQVKDASGEYTIDAQAVILATGGFESNPEMIAKYDNPGLAHIHLAPSQGNMGDGIVMAEKLGAELRNMDLIQLSCAVAPFSIQMQLPIKNNGVVFINKEGKRFTNEYSEASSDRRITEDILKQTDAECFGVYNETIYQTFMAIEEKDFFDEYRMTGIDNSGTVVKADTLEELAEKLGVDQETFLATMNGLKTDNIGNEEVVKLADTYKSGPYYAVTLTPGVMDTLGGVLADTTGRVINKEGKPIKGLYAAGEVIGNVQGAYYSVGLGEAVVFGRVSARNAIEYIKDRQGLTEHVPFDRGTPQENNAETAKGNFTDGTFTGEGQGNNGPIKVEVTVKDGSITEIQVLEQAETPNIYAGAEEQFIPELIKTQNLEIDAVAGATNSSNGLREAVKNALKQ